jgi:hypothetical protein
MTPNQFIEPAAGLLLVIAILVMPATTVAQQPASPPDEDARTLELDAKTRSPI